MRHIGWPQILKCSRLYRQWCVCSSHLLLFNIIKYTIHINRFIATLSVTITSLICDNYFREGSRNHDSVFNGLFDDEFNYTTTPNDNAYSCLYVSMFVSLLGIFLSGLCTVVCKRTVNDKERELFRIHRPVDGLCQ